MPTAPPSSWSSVLVLGRALGVGGVGAGQVGAQGLDGGSQALRTPGGQGEPLECGPDAGLVVGGRVGAEVDGSRIGGVAGGGVFGTDGMLLGGGDQKPSQVQRSRSWPRPWQHARLDVHRTAQEGQGLTARTYAVGGSACPGGRGE